MEVPGEKTREREVGTTWRRGLQAKLGNSDSILQIVERDGRFGAVTFRKINLECVLLMRTAVREKEGGL